MDSLPLSDERPSGFKPGSLAIPYWLRNLSGAAIVAAVVFGLWGTLSIVIDIGRPFGRYLTYGFTEQTAVELSQETPRWWPPIATGALQYGDRITHINGLSYRDNAQAEFDRAIESAETVQLTVSRPGVEAPLLYDLPVTRFTVGEFLDVKLPEFVVGIVYLLLAGMVLRANPNAPTNRVFAFVAACVAIHRLSTVTTIANHGAMVSTIPRLAHMVAAGLVGPMLIHLSFLFPSPLERPPRKVLAFLYALGLFGALILCLSRLPIWGWWTPEQGGAIANAALDVLLYMLLGGVITLFTRLYLSWRNRKNVSRRERRVVKIVAIGLMVSMPAVIVVLAPIIPLAFPLAEVRTSFWESLDVRYFLLAIPIAFALAIVRYQTFQGPSPAFLFVIVLSSSALAAALGVAAIEFFNSNDTHLVRRPPFIIFFLGIFITSWMWSRQTDWRGWFGRFLNRADRNYESVRSFGNRVMGRHDFRTLPTLIAQALADELDLERAAVWLWEPSSRAYRLAASAGGQDPPAEPLIHSHGPLPNHAFQVAWPTTPKWLQSSMTRGRYEALVPLATTDHLIGLLGLGRRWDEDVFDDRDLAVAELVGQQATLFLMTATQVEELRRVPARVAEAQEKERLRLAGELHDTIQQFLGRLPFFLATSRDLMDVNRTKSLNLMEQMLTDVEEAAGTLREIRANLAPNQLESSLSRPLLSLESYVKRHSKLQVVLEMPDDLDEITSVGTRQTLYRVIRQAIDNVIAHAEASEVIITLSRERERVLFSVKDNGRGSSLADIEAAQAAGSFGLRSMRARIETVGGEFSFETDVGKGTRVAGWVPVAEWGRR